MGTPVSGRALSVIALAALVVVASVLAPASADAQLNVTGQWATLPYLSPINPIHVALMKNGKVLIVGGSENNQNNTVYKNAVWNPATGTFSQQTTPWDLFCNGMSFLPDGRVIMTGGNITYDPFFGPPYTTIFDPATEKFYRLEDMAGGRWYPSNALLNDGGTLTFGGLDATGGTNTTVEIYDVGGGWSSPYPAPFTPGWYPRLHLLPNGKVFMSGPTPTGKTFDPAQGVWSSGGPVTKYGDSRLYGSSVLLPLSPDDGYKPAVVIFGGNTQTATNTVEYVDLGTWPEQWVSMPSMAVPRVNMNAVLLPNGKILTFGGSTKFNDPGTAHYLAQTFDPVSQTWTSSGTMAYHRLYHSSALLLPDATVWVAGSNPNRDTWTPQMEIYKPPYLFTSSGAAAPRPTISSTPAVVGYGQTFTVGTPDAAGVSKVLLMRPGSNTHAFDMEQRLVHMDFTKGSGTLSVTAPTSAGAAPPGYYMLFILNASGVPSVAKFIQLMPHPTNKPPTATITNPSTSSVSIPAGGSVTFAGSASDPDGSIALYTWIFPGGSPKKSNAPTPGAVTFPTPGVYTVSLTVLDNLGVNNPSPPTVTVNVGGTAALGASINSPGNGATVSGTVSVSMSAINPQGSPTQFVLKLDNATTLSTQSVSSGSTATYAWNTTAVADGSHSLNLTVTDGAGRTATAAITVTVSNGTGGGGGGGGTGPSVSLTAPPNGVWIGNSVKVSVTASGATSIKIYGNGGVVLTQTCTTSPCTLENWWVTGSLPDAAYQIQAVAMSSSGAWTTTPAVVVYKNKTLPVIGSGAPPSSDGGDGGGDTTGGGGGDTTGGGGGDTTGGGGTAPSVTQTAPPNGVWIGNSVKVSATASGAASIKIYGNGGVVLSQTCSASPCTLENWWVTGSLPDAAYQIQAVATDVNGAFTTTPAVVVYKNQTSPVIASGAPGSGGGGTTSPPPPTGGGGSMPTVEITTPFNGDWTGNSIKVSASATDDVGLASIKLYGNGTQFGPTFSCGSGMSCTATDWWLTGSLPPGQHTIHAVATDTAGNSTTSATVTINK